MKKAFITFVALDITLILLSFIRPLCDFYADHIYGGINFIVGSLTGALPFALGEILMYLGAVVLLLLIAFTLLLIFLHKKSSYRSFLKKYSLLTALIFSVVVFVYCTNWLLPFRASVLKVSDNERTSFTAKEVLSVRNMVVTRLNELSAEVDRDENGHLLYAYEITEIQEALQAKAPAYTRLSGHYSPYKEALCSDFLEWMSIGGYNYPYTMEPTLNKYCDKLYTPVLYAHELAHHKGYYKENEANFLAYIALAECDNKFLSYAAYINMYYYLEQAVFDSLGLTEDGVFSEEDYNFYVEYMAEAPKLSGLVAQDEAYALEQSDIYYEENVNEEAREVFEEAAEEAADTGWQVQGEILKENTYSGVTLMLLQYYVQ